MMMLLVITIGMDNDMDANRFMDTYIYMYTGTLVRYALKYIRCHCNPYCQRHFEIHIYVDIHCIQKAVYVSSIWMGFCMQ